MGDFDQSSLTTEVWFPRACIHQIDVTARALGRECTSVGEFFFLVFYGTFFSWRGKWGWGIGLLVHGGMKVGILLFPLASDGMGKSDGGKFLGMGTSLGRQG
jgi:hypothetical protein